ncbi:hypothetical protein D9M68_321000 [compost metagenome]
MANPDPDPDPWRPQDPGEPLLAYLDRKSRAAGLHPLGLLRQRGERETGRPAGIGKLRRLLAFEETVIGCAVGLLERGEQLISAEDRERLWQAILRIDRLRHRLAGMGAIHENRRS